MSYLALYRKYRPVRFDQVIGQEPVTLTLKNQIRTGRIGHAYLFSGTRGTGKTSVAKIFARAVSCEHPGDGEPCNECEICRSALEGRNMDIVEMDAASNNGVDNIRTINDEVAYLPTEGKYKVYIIDEAHMLSPGAFNALLKTLEEPPSHVIFILATTEPNKIPVTIQSRCQRYDFGRISTEDIFRKLKELLEQEQTEAEDEALRFIARKAQGGMRDALSLTDQCISAFAGQKLTYEKVLSMIGGVDIEVLSTMFRHIARQEPGPALKLFSGLIDRGKDPAVFVSDMIGYMRSLLMTQASLESADLLEISPEDLPRVEEDAGMVRESVLMRYIRVLSDLESSLKTAVSKRVLVETALIKLCRPQMEKDTVSVLERVRRLEKLAAEGAVLTDTPPVPVTSGRDTGGLPPNEEAPLQEGTSGPSPDKEELPKAAPADLVEIKRQWKSITAGLKDGRARAQFSGVELMFEPDGSDDMLVIVFPDFMGTRYLSDKTVNDQLKELIEARIGKKVELKIVFREDLPALEKKVSPIVMVDDVLKALSGAQVIVTDEDIDE